MSMAAAGAILGALGVGLGAFGAHALEGVLDERGRALWDTASRYHLIHAVASVLAAIAQQDRAALLFILGVVVFSGTLYAMALSAPKWLGAVTPIGGLLLIAGWVVLAWSQR